MRKQKTGTLQIFRPKAYYAMMRGLVIRIDGDKVGSVGNDKAFEIDLQTGHHAVSVHMDWCRSQPFEFQIDEGQLITLSADLNDGILGGMLYPYINWNNLYKLSLISDNKKRKNNN